MARKLLKTWKYKAGYHVRYEEVSGEEAGGGPSFVMRSAYTPDGQYLGDPSLARFLIVKMGIAPEKSDESHCVCSIGFCEEKQKWYGWSHRAIVGFGVGDRIFEEVYGDENTPFVEHGQEVIVSLLLAKQSAINFAESVS